MKNETRFRIGTRGSQLALWQANMVKDLLDVPAEVHVIKTSGDRLLSVPLQGRIDKGFFTKEIEQALMDHEVDAAIHSLKDLPTENPPGLVLGATPPRASVNDVLLVSPDAYAPDEPFPVKKGSVIGATSLRRQALLKSFRPDLEPSLMRGNVPTRISKIVSGEFDAAILARAGLERLKLDIAPLKAFDLNPYLWPCASGQGAVGVQIRENDPEVERTVAKIDHTPTRQAVDLERDLLVAFGCGCHDPFACWVQVENEKFSVLIASLFADGSWKTSYFENLNQNEVLPRSIAWRDGEVEGSEPSFSSDELCKPARSW